MKATRKLKIVSAIVTLCSIAALTAQADPDTYQGRRVRGVETQNGGAVQTRSGAGAVETQNGGAVQTRRGGTAVKTENGTAVQTRNGNVYTDPNENASARRNSNTRAVETPNGTAVRTPNGVYTKPK
ncbi:MAG: hypothetical protein ACXWKG_14680 [Limisphaerales bacterium]